MNQVMLDETLHKIHNLPSLPTVVMELLASIANEDVNIDELAQEMSQDQALTAKTLRLANSSFYGMARQITTIAEAIAILGFRTVRSIATTAALIDNFSHAEYTSFHFPTFWRHAMAAAVCARELAPHLHIDPEHAYTAGLLHDIGRLVLVTQFQTQYAATLAYRSAHDCHLVEAEQAVLGIDHAQVGQSLTQHWKFPLTIQQALAQHHAPHCQNMSTLSLVVIAADALAHALDLSNDTNDLVAPLPEGLWQKLGLDEQVLLQVLANTELQFATASLILNE